MSVATKNNFVRITLDDSLAVAVNLIQQEYPLLSTAEAVKLILSRGLKAGGPSLDQILDSLKTTNPIKQDLTEGQAFEEWEKFSQSF